MPEIRNYETPDEKSWLRCRVLAFLDTCYYDDVWTKRPTDSQIQLVAAEGADVVGILDVCIQDELATIDTVCVHPNHQHRGIGTALLAEGMRRLPATVTTLDAWTREDPDTLAWYRSRGFGESDHYLHVYKGWNEPGGDGWSSPAPLSGPLLAYCQASLEHEAQLRATYERVYVCRRFSQPIMR
ncbi:GNAT family N-acetyltransferase [Luteococcus sanguinis]|uniref:GNAT family N-acetyltransferase n=1 Tax=Luteococcus sanguinis TaxID=174038 RepID=A0ABW1WZC2_9ACTN